MKKKTLADSPHVRSVHELLRLNAEEAPTIQFVESKTEVDGGYWEATLMPNDQFGPSRIVYRYAFVEVWRSREKNGKQQLVSVFDWDDDEFEVKIVAATILDFWEEELTLELIRASEINAYIEVCIDDVLTSHDYELFGKNVVIFRQDDDETWVTMLMPKDYLGPSQVFYRREHIEVLRYWTYNGDPELVMTINWDDPQLLTKVLIAATEDICADWSFVG